MQLSLMSSLICSWRKVRAYKTSLRPPNAYGLYGLEAVRFFENVKVSFTEDICMVLVFVVSTFLWILMMTLLLFYVFLDIWLFISNLTLVSPFTVSIPAFLILEMTSVI